MTNATVNNTRDVSIGDVYMMNFSGVGSEQCGWRPGLVFQNNVGNKHSPCVIALPFTSSIKKTRQPTHVYIPAKDSGLVKDSILLCENPQRMSKSSIGRFITKLSDEQMRKVACASILASAAICFIPVDELLELQQKAVALNAV